MSQPGADPMVDCQGLVHIYKGAGLEVVALQGLDLSVERAEMVAIVGRSGSGKTTLMNVLAGLDTPSAGSAMVAGWDLTRLAEPERATYRREAVGYVWQHAHTGLVEELSALQNVQLPMLPAGVPWHERRSRATQLLAAIGLRHRLSHRPSQLSAGEQQRVAIAVALANNPPVLLADEPTAELDSGTARRILEDLHDLQGDFGLTAVVVTHDPELARHVDRVLRIRDGRTSTETRWVATGAETRADELVIMDRAYRLQVPPALAEAAGLRGRVRLLLQGRGVLILPADAPQEEGEQDA